MDPEQRAEVLADNYVFRVRNLTVAAAAEEEGQRVTWITAEDDRVCEDCDGLAGSYESDDINLLLNFPPVHLRCRCVIVPE